MRGEPTGSQRRGDINRRVSTLVDMELSINMQNDLFSVFFSPFFHRIMAVISRNEVLVLVGHLLYVSTLFSGSLYVGDVSKKIVLYAVGFGIGHFLIFLPGLVELIKEHDRKSVVFFYIGFQLILLAQDMYPVKLEAETNQDGSSEYKDNMKMTFFIVYGICEGVGAILLAGSVYWIQFFDPSQVEKAGLLKVLMATGLLLGIVGSTLYSLSDIECVHYTGTGIIGVSTIISTFAFIAGRWNWLRPDDTKDDATLIYRPRRTDIEKEPLMKRIKAVKIPKPGPASPRNGSV